MRILVTGAGGRIGSLVTQALKERYYVRGHDRAQIPWLQDVVVSDLTDYDALLRATEGIDAVAHIGGRAGGNDWNEIHPSNILGTYHVFEACRENGVRRVVFASRAGVLRRDLPPRQMRTVDMTTTPLGLYTVSKVYGEAMAYSYAHQHDMECVCVRIGNFNAARPLPEHPHHLGHRDCVTLFEKALTHPGVKFEIVFGVSGSNWPLYDLEHGRKAIGYYPEEWAEVPEEQWTKM